MDTSFAWQDGERKQRIERMKKIESSPFLTKRVDLRPTLPEAIKEHPYTWTINGEQYNYLRSANKYGEECGVVRRDGHEIFAKFKAGSNFIVAVFLAVKHTDLL